MLVLIKSYNCTYTSHIISCILLKCCKENEPKDEQLCITVHTINDNICDTDPLDNSSNKIQIKQHCLTYMGTHLASQK